MQELYIPRNRICRNFRNQENLTFTLTPCMKSPYFKILLTILLCVTLLSCSDNDAEKKSNEFTIEGKTYSLAESEYGATEEKDSDNNPVHAWQVVLRDETAQYSSEISFALYHTDGSSMPVGTYTFRNDGTKDDFTFAVVIVGVYDVATKTQTWYDDGVKSGTIKVEKSGDTYTITIDAVLEGDFTIKAYYDGLLKLF